MTASCFYCGRALDPTSRYVWHRVLGWERKAVGESRRSGSDIALREPREEFAHDRCVSNARDGIAPQQGALL